MRTTRLGFGTAALMRIASARDRDYLLAAAWDAGIRHFDTAPIYGLGESERALGRFLRGRREAFTVTTKYGMWVSAMAARLAPLQSIGRAMVRRLPALRRAVRGRAQGLYDRPRLSGTVARASLEISLRALQLDHVDFYLAHDCADQQLDDESLLETLVDLRERGLISAFGTATARTTTLRLLETHPRLCPVVQFEHLANDSVPSSLANTHGVITHGVLGDALTHLIHDAALRQRWSRVLDLDLGSPEALARLLMRTALAANPTGIVLFQTTSARHILTNVLVATTPLEPDRLRRVQRLAAALHAGEGLPYPA